MAALGHEQTSERDRATTAFHPKKDTLRSQHRSAKCHKLKSKLRPQRYEPRCRRTQFQFSHVVSRHPDSIWSRSLLCAASSRSWRAIKAIAPSLNTIGTPP
jgi:hypothetical protein